MDFETPKEYEGDNFNGAQPFIIKDRHEQNYNQQDSTNLLKFCKRMEKEDRLVPILDDKKRKQLIIEHNSKNIQGKKCLQHLMSILTTHAKEINRELEIIELSILLSLPGGEIQDLHTDYNFIQGEDRPKRYYGIWALQDGTKMMGKLGKSSQILSTIPLNKNELLIFRNDFPHAGCNYKVENYRIHVIFGKKGDTPNNEIGLLVKGEQEMLCCKAKDKGCTYTASNVNTMLSHQQRCRHCRTEKNLDLQRKRRTWNRNFKKFFKQLKKYEVKHKHCRVKKSENKALFNFCQMLRKEEAKLTQTMTNKLKEVKFFHSMNR